jgi:NADPH2:quinone reductase
MTNYAMTMPAPGGADRFTRTPIEPGPPGPGEALIRHTAIGLNFLDIYHRSGTYPWPVERDLVVGSEGAGIVEAVGDGVDHVAPGDRVAYTIPLGAYATRRSLPADRLVRLPDAVPDEIAASILLKGLTAHYLIHSTFRVEKGMTVLVHAASGGVGLLLGQWLAHIGATAIGTAGGSDKVALAKAHGYAHVIDYRREDFVAEVRRITGGAGLPVVYDSVGRDTWEGSLKCLAPRGFFVCFGQSSGPVEGFTLGHLAAGQSLYATRPSLFHYIATREELAERAEALFALVADGTLRAEVRQRFALEDVADAHRALEERRTTGATVLIP